MKRNQDSLKTILEQEQKGKEVKIVTSEINAQIRYGLV